MSEKEKRAVLLKIELETLIKATEDYCWEILEEEFEPAAIKAIQRAAEELAYKRKYYDVMKDEVLFFPTVARLLMTNALTERAELYYYEEEDPFPPAYSKALKTVCRESGLVKDDESTENDDYMEKLAQDVDPS